MKQAEWKADEQIRPLFHYTYKSEAIILDCRHNYQGSLLAVVNSVGDLLLYSANSSQSLQPQFILQKKPSSVKPILRVAWSLPLYSLLATASLSGDLTLYECVQSSLKHLKTLWKETIPLCISFCPIQSKVMLSVGFSGGAIAFYDAELKEITALQAHSQAVNQLAWQHHILNYQKNKWITANFEHMDHFVKEERAPFLASVSSDGYLKVWSHELALLASIKAHTGVIRGVQWKPTYLLDSDRLLITCSEDRFVSLWRLRRQENAFVLENKSYRQFNGPVFKAEYNFLGSLVAISYASEQQEKVKTIIIKQVDGILKNQISL